MTVELKAFFRTVCSEGWSCPRRFLRTVHLRQPSPFARSDILKALMPYSFVFPEYMHCSPVLALFCLLVIGMGVYLAIRAKSFVLCFGLALHIPFILECQFT